MSTRPRVYRDALQVSPQRIAQLNDGELNSLMGELLVAQAYRCRSRISEVRTSAELKASDDGCDGWTPKPEMPDDWLGDSDTCWQFKSRTAGQPAKLAGEILKEVPRQTLIDGGRYVLVASGITNAKSGEDARRKVLVDDAVGAGIPVQRIEVIGSERLAIWCNQHPAIAARWTGYSDGIWTFDRWSELSLHRFPWHPTRNDRTAIDAYLRAVDFLSQDILHLHVHGQPGVGKTRFVLELCRMAPWRHSVVYVRQAAEVSVFELVSRASADPSVRLVVVADEAQADQLPAIRDAVDHANGRIKVITIGHCKTPDPDRIPARLIRPLPSDAMGEIVREWHPSMPREHVDFVVGFADGYVRLAKLAASAVAANSSTNVHDLVRRDEISGFLDQMLGANDRRALYVVAVLSRVGWTGELQHEGQAVAQHLGIEWGNVCADVARFDRTLGIVPQGGRYRYVSPTPLGTYLAMEAWKTFPDLLRSLPNVLPSSEARTAYFERLSTMASGPPAQAFARDELTFFFEISHFSNQAEVRRWAALAAADPELAARNVLGALSNASVEERRSARDGARRAAVSTLVRIAWRKNAFHDAVTALALLAEAENETWANNATAEFVAKFSIYLGGTAVPYVDRLSVLDELLEVERLSLSSLVVRALAKVGDRHFTRSSNQPISDDLREPEWSPNPNGEYLQCVNAGFARLVNVARRRIPGLQDELITAVREADMMLRNELTRDLVVELMDAIHEGYPDSREALRSIVARILHDERKYWKELSEEELEKLHAVHAHFADASLFGRVQQLVGHADWDASDHPDLHPIATELLRSREGLREIWPWLTSGQASAGWWLGEALAAVDPDGELNNLLPALPNAGADIRALCGFVTARRRLLGDRWYDDWVDRHAIQKPSGTELLFELAWRCGATESIASELAARLCREEVAERIVGQLTYGAWSAALSQESLLAVLQAMASAGHESTAVVILGRRLQSNPTELGSWRELALRLVTEPKLIRSDHLINHVWAEVALKLVGGFPGEIAKAIMCEQADRDTDTWFAEFSEAKQVLEACVDVDPVAMWDAMEPNLQVWVDAHRFSIGFPRSVLERLPANEVIQWIRQQPRERASVAAKLVRKDVSSDNTLAAKILGEYGDDEVVADEFKCEFTSVAGAGPISARWDQIAKDLEQAARNTALPKLRRWATDTARELRSSATKEREREEEEELRLR